MSKKDRRKELVNATLNAPAPEVEEQEEQPVLLKATVAEEPVKSQGVLFSRLDYPVEIKYKNESIIVTPRAKLPLEDFDAVDQSTLPAGILIRRIK